jgi:hypothetical protein
MLTNPFTSLIRDKRTVVTLVRCPARMSGRRAGRLTEELPEIPP